MKGEYEGEEFDAFTFALRTSRKYIFAGMWSFLNKLQKLNKNRGTTMKKFFFATAVFLFAIAVSNFATMLRSNLTAKKVQNR